MEGRAEQGWSMCSNSLAAQWLHAHCEAREDRVAGDIGETNGEGTAGKGETAKAAKEDHGDEGTRVVEESSERNGRGERESALGLRHVLVWACSLPYSLLHPWLDQALVQTWFS